MNIFITGIAGLIGTTLVETLQKYDKFNHFKINGIDKLDNFFITKDLHDVDDYEELIKKSDIVIHCASFVGVKNVTTYPEMPIISTFEIDKKIVDCCAKNNIKLIYLSTSEVYGSGDYLTEKSPLIINSELRSNYALEKLFIERYIDSHICRSDFLIIRPFNITGIYQSPSKGVIPKFIDTIVSNKNLNELKLSIRVDDTEKNVYSSRCYCDVEDFCLILLELIQNWPYLELDDNRIYNIGNPYNKINSKELALKILKFATNYKKLNSDLETYIEYIIPHNLNSFDYEINERVPCIDKIKEALKPFFETFKFKELSQIIEDIFVFHYKLRRMYE